MPEMIDWWIVIEFHCLYLFHFLRFFFYFYFQTSDVLLNDSFQLPDTSSDYELFYRHTVTLTAVYCVAYVIVFLVGLIGNSFVIAVVLRSPKMRTTTNFFIVNLAMADILVIVFCLPATLMSNIFVREYYTINSLFINFQICFSLSLSLY